MDVRKPETILRELVEQAYARGLTTSQVMQTCYVNYAYAQEIRRHLHRGVSP